MSFADWLTERARAAWACLALRLPACDGRNDSPIHAADPVGGALDDVQLLMAFAAQSRRSVKADKVERLMTAAEVLRTVRAAGQEPSAAQLTAFWTSYDAFAVDIAPLSAHSIRSSQYLNGLRFPASLFTGTSFHAAAAVAVFSLCLILQAFWVAGDELTRRAAELETQKTKLVERQEQNDAALQRANARLEEKMRRICELGTCTGLFLDMGMTLPARAKTPADQNLLSTLNGEARALRSEVLDKELMGHEFEAEMAKLLELWRPVEQLLTQWHGRACEVCEQKPLRFFCPVDRPKVDPQGTARIDKDIELKKAELARAEAGNALSGDAAKAQAVDRSYSAWSARNVLRRDIGQLEAEKRAKQADNFRNIVVEVRLIAANISAYLIAMALGVLGALTFILRALTTQLREHTYVPVSVSISVVRIVLGAIAGVFGSMLAPGNEVSKSLPPLFVPFIFGYGIEILFSMLDKTVRAFTQPESATPRPT